MKKLALIGLTCLTVSVMASPPPLKLEDQSSAAAFTPYRSAYHGGTTTLYSSHCVHLVNNTPMDQEITYTFSMCVNFGRCEYNTMKKLLKGGETFDDSGSVALDAKFDNPGEYVTHARTEIFGNPHLEANHYETVKVY
jgi:hypothetical protein